MSARISQQPRVRISQSFLYMLPVAVARSSSDGNAIYYVLPVLWMTPCVHIMGWICQNQRRRVCFLQFARWRHLGRSLPSPTASCCSLLTRKSSLEVAPTCLATFFPWPWSRTYDLWPLHWTRWRAKYPGHAVRSHIHTRGNTHRQTHRTDCSKWTTNVVTTVGA